MVEEVRYLPTESNFHSLVRFQTQYYYNGRCLHQDCCKVEIHRPDDIISWNAQKVDEIKAIYRISDVPVEACDANLHKGRLKCDELIHWDEEPYQILVENEPNSAKESSVLVAHQVLEEMPGPFVSDELIFLDEIEKINDELLDGMDSKAPPIGSVDELYGVKVIEDRKLRNAIPTIHALKLPTKLSEQARMMNGVVNAICFDPGGNDFTHGDLAISLPNGNYESKADEEEESIQIARNEKVVVKEISHMIAHQVFDKITDSQDCHPHKLSDRSKVFSDDYQNQAELKTLPTPGAVWLGNGAEKKVKNSIMSLLTNPQKSELHSNYIISGGALVFLSELLNFDIAKDSNLSSAEELIVMTNALVGLASEAIFLSAYGMLIENDACLDAFCFDPGGDIYVTDAYTVMTVDDAQLYVDTNKESLMFDLGGDEFIFGIQIAQNVCSKLIPFAPGGIRLKSLTIISYSIDKIVMIDMGSCNADGLRALVKVDKLDDGHMIRTLQREVYIVVVYTTKVYIDAVCVICFDPGQNNHS